MQCTIPPQDMRLDFPENGTTLKLRSHRVLPVNLSWSLGCSLDSTHSMHTLCLSWTEGEQTRSYITALKEISQLTSLLVLTDLNSNNVQPLCEFSPVDFKTFYKGSQSPFSSCEILSKDR